MTKVKVKLTTSLAGVETLPAGMIIETTAKEASSLVGSGFAEYIDEIENAAAPPPREKAAQLPKKKKTTRKK